MIDIKLRFSKCYYLSSTPKIRPKYLDCFGFIISIQTAPRYKLMAQHPWCLDNDAFNSKFEINAWYDRLIQCLEYSSTCTFVVCPDKVYDHAETLRRFEMFSPIVKGCGYPVALVTQDGLTPDITPWDQLDVLFVGGSDEHKLGREAGALIAEGQKRNKWIHIGRVNSPKRMLKFWMANSWDGTHIGYEPDNASPKIAACVRRIREWQKMERMF
jgi:hypothetical protein